MDKEAFKERVFRDFAAMWTKPDEQAMQAYADAAEELQGLPEHQRTTITAMAEALLTKAILEEFPLALVLNEMCRVTGKDPNTILNRGLAFHAAYLRNALALFRR